MATIFIGAMEHQASLSNDGKEVFGPLHSHFKPRGESGNSTAFSQIGVEVNLGGKASSQPLSHVSLVDERNLAGGKDDHSPVSREVKREEKKVSSNVNDEVKHVEREGGDVGYMQRYSSQLEGLQSLIDKLVVGTQPDVIVGLDWCGFVDMSEPYYKSMGLAKVQDMFRSFCQDITFHVTHNRMQDKDILHIGFSSKEGLLRMMTKDVRPKRGERIRRCFAEQCGHPRGKEGEIVFLRATLRENGQWPVGDPKKDIDAALAKVGQGILADNIFLKSGGPRTKSFTLLMRSVAVARALVLHEDMGCRDRARSAV